MLEVDKLVKSILAFVNFFAARIALAAFLVLLIRFFTGSYYFDLAKGYIDSGNLFALDYDSLIARAGIYLDEKNVKNALFAAVLIVGLSLLDILYPYARRPAITF